MKDLSGGKLPVVGYGRADMEGRPDAASREEQLDAVQKWVQKHDALELKAFYFDGNGTEHEDGAERPEFLRMMKEIRQEGISCLVVKKLALVGCNFVEAAYYIETIFPFLGVRLVAVEDGFDSDRPEDMRSLEQAMRHDADERYAREMSHRIWDSLQKSKQQGLAGGNFAPFGYIRNPRTGRNEIDSAVALYVQMIFQWKLMGLSCGEIADRLELLRVPTPSQRLAQLGLRKSAQTGKWNVGTLRLILSNQTYVGDTVRNKSVQALFAGQEKTGLEREEWIITPDTHPAIIARDDFEKVQELLKEQTRGGRRKSREASDREEKQQEVSAGREKRQGVSDGREKRQEASAREEKRRELPARRRQEKRET